MVKMVDAKKVSEALEFLLEVLPCGGSVIMAVRTAIDDLSVEVPDTPSLPMQFRENVRAHLLLLQHFMHENAGHFGKGCVAQVQQSLDLLDKLPDTPDVLGELHVAIVDFLRCIGKFGERPVDNFDRVSDAFTKDTGMVAPSRDQAAAYMGTPTQDEREAAFKQWREQKRQVMSLNDARYKLHEASLTMMSQAGFAFAVWADSVEVLQAELHNVILELTGLEVSFRRLEIRPPGSIEAEPDDA